MSSHTIDTATAKRIVEVDEAAAHDKRFRKQVGAAITEADDPTAEWVTSQEANDSWARSGPNSSSAMKRAAIDAVWLHRAEQLVQHPEMGRPSRVHDTRALIVSGDLIHCGLSHQGQAHRAAARASPK